MEKLWLIIKREYLTRVRHKSFIIMTFVTPLGILLLSFLIGYLTTLNNDKVKEVLVLDNTATFSSLFENTKTIKYTYLTHQDKEEIKQKAIKEKKYAFLYLPETFLQDVPTIEYYSEESASNAVVEAITSKIEEYLFYQNLEKANIQLAEIGKAKTKVNVILQNFSGETTSKIANIVKMVFGFLISYLLMMFIVIYGNMIMRSVIEEKTNRIVEIIISSVKSFDLMLGKILGTAMVGITQFLLWIFIAGGLFLLASTYFGIEPAATHLPSMQNVPYLTIIQSILSEIAAFPVIKMLSCFLLYFIGGYLLYSSLYASIGAVVDSETDTQQFLMPVLIPLMLAIYIGFFTTSEDPNGVISVIFSYIPLTSPIVMLMRIPFGVSWGEILVSLTLVYLTFFAFLWIGSKIYRIGILSYGQKTSYKDLYKWIKNG